MLALYTEPKPFENFCDEDICSNWRKLISKNVHVNINLSKEDLESELNDPYSPIFLFYQSIGSGENPKARSEYINKIKLDFTLLEKHPFDMFILNIENETAEKLKKNFGVEVYAEEEFDGDLKQYEIDDDFLENEIVQSEGGIQFGWGEVLKDFSYQNSNAVVIVDRNLFSNEERRVNLGVLNLKSYLDSVIRKDLEIPYQVLIISELNGDIGIEHKRTEIIDSLMENLKELRDFEIELELLLVHRSMTTYKYTHGRKILQNYHIGTSQHGFNMFKSKGKVRTDNDFTLHNIFIRFKKARNLFKRLRNIVENAEDKLLKQGQNDRFFRLYNGRDEVLKVNNRLINSRID